MTILSKIYKINEHDAGKNKGEGKEKKLRCYAHASIPTINIVSMHCTHVIIKILKNLNLKAHKIEK